MSDGVAPKKIDHGRVVAPYPLAVDLFSDLLSDDSDDQPADRERQKIKVRPRMLPPLVRDEEVVHQREVEVVLEHAAQRDSLRALTIVEVGLGVDAPRSLVSIAMMSSESPMRSPSIPTKQKLLHDTDDLLDEICDALVMGVFTEEAT